MPKFAKVDKYTIKITSEQSQAVPVFKLISQRKILAQKIVQLKETLKNMDEIIAEAKKLGISIEAPEPAPKKEAGK